MDRACKLNMPITPLRTLDSVISETPESSASAQIWCSTVQSFVS
jgi:hypothetical protein